MTEMHDNGKDDDPWLLCCGCWWRWGVLTQQPTINGSIVDRWVAGCKMSSEQRKGEGRCG